MNDKIIKTLQKIAEDMRNDAEKFDGHLNRKTIAEYFGAQGAAISALAGIMKTILIKEKP